MTPGELQDALRRHSGKRVLLMLNENSSSLLSRKNEAGGVILLRAHRMFLEAAPEVVNDLALWTKGHGDSGKLVDHFIRQQLPQMPRRPARNRITRSQGHRYDLQTMHTELNTRYLGNRSKAAVTWGRSGKRNARHIRLGSYSPVDNVITISPRLDKRDIPRYMVEYVLFHEMLHEVLGIGKRSDGSRSIHGRTFKLLEQTYPFYEQAQVFEKAKWGGK
jgi:hypothetical protein